MNNPEMEALADLIIAGEIAGSRFVYEQGDDGGVIAVEFSEDGEPLLRYRVNLTLDPILDMY